MFFPGPVGAVANREEIRRNPQKSAETPKQYAEIPYQIHPKQYAEMPKQKHPYQYAEIRRNTLSKTPSKNTPSKTLPGLGKKFDRKMDN